jgi:Rab-like protein 3
MVSFLQNLKLSTEVPAPEHLGSIRIVVVGDPGVGKTALINYITSGKPVRSVRSTAGCQVSVKLIEQQAQDSKATSLGAPAAQSKFFVEFWDVSGHEHYAVLRKVFFKQVNGVILVYDVNNRTSLRRLQRWAMEIATEGSFVAPFNEDLASRNIGGLPVPVLVIGTKADRLRTTPTLSAATPTKQICSSTEAVTQLCTGWLKRSRSSGLLLRQRVRPSDNNLQELEKHVQGLHASAVTGQLDWETLNSFFSTLWLRRYQPATGSTNTPTFVQQLQARAAVGAAPVGVGRQDMDRLDDDWV